MAYICSYGIKKIKLTYEKRIARILFVLLLRLRYTYRLI